MSLKRRNKLASLAFLIIYLFYVVECLLLGLSGPSDCIILAILFFLGLAIIGLPIFSKCPVMKFLLLGVAIAATVCYSLMMFFFFENIVFIVLSVVNVISFVLLIVLRKNKCSSTSCP